MGLTSPLPVSLPQECKKAAKILTSFSADQDAVIPRDILASARGFAIFTVFKMGFLFSGRAGSGIVIARLPNGQWSAPSAIGIAGGGVGGQAGLELTEFIVVLNSRAAVQTFMSSGSLTLGGNMSIAVGPLGRNAEGSGSLNTKGKVAAMYSYSKTKGLFGGVSVEGGAIVERSDANSKAYGFDVKARQLLSGEVEPPEWADVLLQAVGRRAGTTLDDNWIDDSPVSSPTIATRNRGYSFDSPHSAVRSNSSPKSKSSSRFSKFSPTLSRSSSSSNSKLDKGFSEMNINETIYSSEDEDARGVWAADAQRSPSSTWRETTSRSRSGTIIPAVSSKHRRQKSEDPFEDPDDPPAAAHRYSIDTLSVSSQSDTDQTPINFNGSKIPQQKANFSRAPATSSGFRDATDTPPLPSRPKPALPVAVALYDFQSSESGDLAFKKHDVIQIVKKIDGEEWWVGRANGKEGIFPINYVDLI